MLHCVLNFFGISREIWFQRNEHKYKVQQKMNDSGKGKKCEAIESIMGNISNLQRKKLYRWTKTFFFFVANNSNLAIFNVNWRLYSHWTRGEFQLKIKSNTKARARTWIKFKKSLNEPIPILHIILLKTEL